MDKRFMFTVERLRRRGCGGIAEVAGTVLP